MSVSNKYKHFFLNNNKLKMGKMLSKINQVLPNKSYENKDFFKNLEDCYKILSVLKEASTNTMFIGFINVCSNNSFRHTVYLDYSKTTKSN